VVRVERKKVLKKKKVKRERKGWAKKKKIALRAKPFTN
jgi:hypothetical protein